MSPSLIDLAQLTSQAQQYGREVVLSGGLPLDSSVKAAREVIAQQLSRAWFLGYLAGATR